jgi:hypothetical protein
VAEREKKKLNSFQALSAFNNKQKLNYSEKNENLHLSHERVKAIA